MAQAINERLFGGAKLDPNAAGRGWEIGKESGQLGVGASPVSFLNTAIQKYRQTGAENAEMAVAKQKARVAGIQRILTEGSLPNAHPEAKKAAMMISEQLKSDPMFAQAIGLDPSETSGLNSELLSQMGFKPSKFTSGGVTYESSDTAQNERADEARKIDFNLAAKANEDIAVIGESVDILENLFNKAVPDPKKSGTEAIFGGKLAGLGSKLGLNEDLRSFRNVKDSMASLFSKGLFREAGVLTNQDIQRAMAALPSEEDSATTLQNKLTALKRLVSVAKQNYLMKRESFISGKDFVPVDSGITSFDKDISSSGQNNQSERIKALGLDPNKYEIVEE